MTNHKRLTDALKFVDPDVAGSLDRAGRAARDARRARRSDGLEDEALLPEGMAARLRAEGREDPNRALTRARMKAKRAAKAAARDLEDAPTGDALEKFSAYHAERAVQEEAPVPPASKADSTDDIPLADIDIRAESLARRARNAALQKATAKTEAQAEADWVKRTGGKSKLGVGFKEHGREEAGRSAPLPLDQEADAAALEEFRRLAESGEAPWLEPRQAFDPLAGHVSPRTRRKDARAERATAADSSAQGDEQGQAKRRVCRDKDDCQPPATRGR